MTAARRRQGDTAKMIDERLYQTFLDRLLAGDRHHCQEMVFALLERQVDIKTIYVGLFQRGLYEVGERWETNRISVAAEHVATATVESLITMLYPQIFGAEHVGRTSLIACTEGEWHQVGGKMAADILELNGWDSHFLGASTDPERLLTAIEEVKPEVVGLSLSLPTNIGNLVHAAQAIASHYPGIEIFCGGQAFRWGGREEIRRLPRTRYIASLDDLEEAIG